MILGFYVIGILSWCMLISWIYPTPKGVLERYDPYWDGPGEQDA